MAEQERQEQQVAAAAATRNAAEEKSEQNDQKADAAPIPHVTHKPLDNKRQIEYDLWQQDVPSDLHLVLILLNRPSVVFKVHSQLLSFQSEQIRSAVRKHDFRLEPVLRMEIVVKQWACTCPLDTCAEHTLLTVLHGVYGSMCPTKSAGPSESETHTWHRLYNAVDMCKRLGMSQDVLNWYDAALRKVFAQKTKATQQIEMHWLSDAIKGAHRHGLHKLLADVMSLCERQARRLHLMTKADFDSLPEDVKYQLMQIGSRCGAADPSPVDKVCAGCDKNEEGWKAYSTAAGFKVGLSVFAPDMGSNLILRGTIVNVVQTRGLPRYDVQFDWGSFRSSVPIGQLYRTS